MSTAAQHKKNKHIARSNMTPDEIRYKVSPWDSRAWREQKHARAMKAQAVEKAAAKRKADRAKGIVKAKKK